MTVMRTDECVIVANRVDEFGAHLFDWQPITCSMSVHVHIATPVPVLVAAMGRGKAHPARLR